MSINGIYQFGTLTTKSGKIINFDDIDRDKDGKISQQEFNFIQKELGLDIVEFVDEDNKGEKKVSDYEFVLWQQEAQMQEAFDVLAAMVAKDFIGNNAKFSQYVLKELRQFLTDFKESYKKSGESLIEMASSFQVTLPAKYEEIKQSYLGEQGSH